MFIVHPSQFRVVVSFVLLLAFLLCYWGSFFCPMVYASGEAIPHHATSQSDPLENDAECPELAVTAMVPWEDTNLAILPIEAEFASLQTGTAVSAFEFSARSLSSSSYPLLFLLLSTLRN